MSHLPIEGFICPHGMLMYKSVAVLGIVVTTEEKLPDENARVSYKAAPFAEYLEALRCLCTDAVLFSGSLSLNSWVDLSVQ